MSNEVELYRSHCVHLGVLPSEKGIVDSLDNCKWTLSDAGQGKFSELYVGSGSLKCLGTQSNVSGFTRISRCFYSFGDNHDRVTVNLVQIIRGREVFASCALLGELISCYRNRNCESIFLNGTPLAVITHQWRRRYIRLENSSSHVLRRRYFHNAWENTDNNWWIASGWPFIRSKEGRDHFPESLRDIVLGLMLNDAVDRVAGVGL